MKEAGLRCDGAPQAEGLLRRCQYPLCGEVFWRLTSCLARRESTWRSLVRAISWSGPRFASQFSQISFVRRLLRCEAFDALAQSRFGHLTTAESLS